MKISSWGLEVIKHFEGFHARPYRDPVGVLTQGYGHTSMAGPPALGGEWSKEYATEVLRKTVNDRYAAPIRAMMTRAPSQAQFDAMVSLTYNIGVGAFQRSSVLRHFNAGNDAAAVASFALWNKAGGRVFKGLVRRRATEALMYQGVRDLDFDGQRDAGEPVYGDLPRGLDPEQVIQDAEPVEPPATVWQLIKAIWHRLTKGR